MKLAKFEEDRQFLQSQRKKGRPGTMLGPDQRLAMKEKRRLQLEQKFKDRVHREQNRRAMAEERSVAADSEGSSDDDSEQDAEFRPAVKKRRSRKAAVLTPGLASALARTNISSSKATFVVAAAAGSSGHSVKDLVISRSSIDRARKRIHKDISDRVREEYEPPDFVIVHWDGKLLKDLTGKTMVDRLPVLVSGGSKSGPGNDKLLGVPKLCDGGTGKAQAIAVTDLLRHWKLTGCLVGMCADTTASNTGSGKGACTLIQEILGEDLLYLACRHHMMELVLGAVFGDSLGPSSAPGVSVFKRFMEAWENIDHSTYDTGVKVKLVRRVLENNEQQDILEYALDQLKLHHPRDDYREILELSVIFLGGVPPRGIHFLQPGAFSHARWMAKAIYCLKIWLFRKQFKLSAAPVKGVREVCIFVVRVYLEQWFTAALAVRLPASDLRFLQLLVQHEKHRPALKGVASGKFSNHLWYLGDNLVPLAFFDESVSALTKKEMLKSLENRSGEGKDSIRARMSPQDSVTMGLKDFISQRSLVFFCRLGISLDFLQCDPESWMMRQDYREGLCLVKSLKVVNDIAERGVALIKEFNESITRDEEQKQYLLQVVEEHRRVSPDCQKKTLIKNENL